MRFVWSNFSLQRFNLYTRSMHGAGDDLKQVAVAYDLSCIGARHFRAFLAGNLAWEQGDMDAAKRHYEKALGDSINEDINSYYIAHCGLANVALTEAVLPKAQHHIVERLSTLDSEWRNSPYLDMRTYLVFSHVLTAAGDPHGYEILEKAYCLLQERAKGIDDPYLWGSYMENVPVNRETVEIYVQICGK